MANSREILKKEASHLVNDIGQKKDFIQYILAEGALACSGDITKDNLAQARKISEDGLTALDAQGGIQTMLAAQMLSIHHLQQKSMFFANSLPDGDSKRYFTNTSIKLANCFVQQANMLAKLQGLAGQKITVERVIVNQGGQAVVGNIQGDQVKK